MSWLQIYLIGLLAMTTLLLYALHDSHSDKGEDPFWLCYLRILAWPVYGPVALWNCSERARDSLRVWFKDTWLYKSYSQPAHYTGAITKPPVHSNCRSATLPVLPDHVVKLRASGAKPGHFLCTNMGCPEAYHLDDECPNANPGTPFIHQVDECPAVSPTEPKVKLPKKGAGARITAARKALTKDKPRARPKRKKRKP